MILGVALLAGAAAQAEAGERPTLPGRLRAAGFAHQTASWTLDTTQIDADGNTQQRRCRAWLSGERYRLEAQDARGRIVVVDTGHDLFFYAPAENRAFRWSPELETVFSNILNQDTVAWSLRTQDKNDEGSENLEGRPCRIMRYERATNDLNQPVVLQVQEWIWIQEPLPLKTVVRAPAHPLQLVFMTVTIPASETVTVMRNLQFDAPVSDTLFRLPEGTTIETLRPDSVPTACPAPMAPSTETP